MESCRLVGSFVVAGPTARFAVHKAVGTDADIELGLAEAAELIALALSFRHFALRTTEFGLAGSGGHRNKVVEAAELGNVTVVTLDC